MKRSLTIVTLLLTTPAIASPDNRQVVTPPHALATPLLANDVDGAGNKEAALLLVEFPPGSVDPIHRHNALVYVYMLEGSVVMQVRGGPEVTLKPGQTFVEKPADIHVVGRNASQTKPAKFLAYFIKDKGAPPVLPAQ